MIKTVSEVALRAPVAVLAETLISEAEQKLIASNSSEIYVINEAEVLCGIVTDSEILNYRLLGGDGQARIAALMSPVEVSLTPESSLDAGARLLRQHPHASIPVVNGERLIGQLCRTSLLRILAEQGGEPIIDAAMTKSAYLPAPKFSLFSPTVHGMRKFAR